MAMEDAEKVSKGLEKANEIFEMLEKAFTDLESRRESSMPNKTQWNDIKEHFSNLGKSLKEQLNELQEKEKLLEEKQSEARKRIAEREAAVAAKELDSWNRLQVLKDTAVLAIEEARKNCKAPTPVLLVDAKASTDNKVSTSAIDEPTAPEENPDNKSDAVPNEAKLRPQLIELCEKMDAKGLLKILSDNRKLLNTISEELSNALKNATEPARLVLDSLEGFYPSDPANSQGSEDNNSNAFQLLRRTCLVVMEASAPLLGMAELPVSSEIKERARAIADEWKAKLAGVDIDASNGHSLEAVAFLQLLATFRIAEEFHEDELCKLVLAVARRRQAPELCRSLGLTHRMPGVVETLVKSGRQVDALHFAFAFQLTESFPPVPLLKEYLNNLERNVQENDGDAASEGAQKDANKELAALRVVIKCIEEYKLQEEYPVEPLKKRVAQLEKARLEKKRTGQATKPQSKKPRVNGVYVHRKPYSSFVDNRQVPPVYGERGMYPGVAGRYSERYPYIAPPAYEVGSHAPYVQQPNPQRTYHYPDERMAPPAPYNASSNYGNYGSTAYGSYAGTGSQSSTVNDYGNAGPGYQSAAPNTYGNYLSTGVQSASPNYGNYMSSGGQPSHQPPYV